MVLESGEDGRGEESVEGPEEALKQPGKGRSGGAGTLSCCLISILHVSSWFNVKRQ